MVSNALVRSKKMEPTNSLLTRLFLIKSVRHGIAQLVELPDHEPSWQDLLYGITSKYLLNLIKIIFNYFTYGKNSKLDGKFILILYCLSH